MAKSKPKSRQQLRRFKSSSTPLLFVVFPLIPALLFVVGLVELNTQEKGVTGFLTAMLATLLSPPGIVVLLALAAYFVHQSQLGKEKLWRKTRLPLFARLRFRRERAPQTCAFCHDSLETHVVSCPGCAVAVHAACQAEARGCVTLGCEHEARPVASTRRVGKKASRVGTA
jgi:hypothetical protein